MQHIETTIDIDSNVLPFSEIGKLPATHSMGNIIKRFVDGLGYRYYWATERLTESDLAFRMGNGARSSLETLEHILNISEFILRIAQQKYSGPSEPKEDLTFGQIRAQTLLKLSLASKLLGQYSDREIESMEILIQQDESKFSLPNWHLLNGPISDAIYHVGQIVSLRRASGNPINPQVDAFLGKNRE